MLRANKLCLWFLKKLTYILCKFEGKFQMKKIGLCKKPCYNITRFEGKYCPICHTVTIVLSFYNLAVRKHAQKLGG